MVDQTKIVKVLPGAIYMSSPLETMQSQPDFSPLDYALSCYFVEYLDSKPFWRFFWSKPKEYGGETFVTDRLKEDLSDDQHRYFNDAIGDNQTIYNTTFSLLSMTAFNCTLSFMYRQHFEASTYAFLGGIYDDNPYGLDDRWVQKFLNEA